MTLTQLFPVFCSILSISIPRLTSLFPPRTSPGHRSVVGISDNNSMFSMTTMRCGRKLLRICCRICFFHYILHLTFSSLDVCLWLISYLLLLRSHSITSSSLLLYRQPFPIFHNSFDSFSRQGSLCPQGDLHRSPWLTLTFPLTVSLSPFTKPGRHMLTCSHWGQWVYPRSPLGSDVKACSF